MANKKINELDSRASLSLSDLLAVGDPTTGYLYKITITDLKTLTGAGVISFNGRVGSVTPAEGDYSLNQLSDVIITSATNGNIVKYNGSNWVNVPMYTGTIAQYVDGTGAYQTFPTLLSSDRLVTEVRNTTGATVTKGTVIYLSGSSGTLPTIAKAQANSEATSSSTYGVVQNDIANNANGYVVVIGNLTGIDTSAFNSGDVLWLSPTVAGGVTTTKPSAPNNSVYIGIVTRSNNSAGTIEVKIQNGYELDELHNVAISSVANNEVLVYESSSTLWKNKSIATILGYTPISLSSLSASAPLSYNSSTGAFTISQASGSTDGYLSSTDWNTFNSKQNALTNPVTGTGTSGHVTYFTGSTSVAGSANFFWDATNNRLGIGLTNPQRSLEIYSATADSHLRLSGSAPSVSMGEAITGSVYQAKFGLATASNQYITGSVAGDFVIISQTASTIWFNNGAERMRVSGSGNVGIGTASPAHKLDVQGGSIVNGNGTIQTALTYATMGIVGTLSNHDLAVYANNAERMRITSTGNVGIGTSSPNTRLHVQQSATYNTINDQLILQGGISGGNPANPAYYGGIKIATADYEWGAIRCIQTNPSASWTNRMAFFTMNGAGGGLLERMAIDNSGNVGIGTTSPQTLLSVETSGTQNTVSPIITSQSSGTTYTGLYSIRDGAGDQRGLIFQVYTANVGLNERMRITSGGDVCINATTSGGYKFYVNGSAAFGSVFVGSLGTGTVYSSSGTLTNTNPSDKRLKDNITPITYGLNEVLQLNPVSFDWKNDNNKNKQFGFIAQEVQKVMPEAVIEGEYLGLEKDAIYTALVNAIKELEARLKTLENK